MISTSAVKYFLVIDTKMVKTMARRGRPRGFDKEEALHRAMEVFWDKGYDHTSMADLTAAMGLKPPSIYAAFGDKEALFKAVVAHYVETEGSGIWSQLESALTAREALSNLLRATANAYTRNGASRGCLIVLAAPQKQSANAAVRDELKARRLMNTHLLEQRLQRAMAEKELPSDLDYPAIASFYATVQHGMSIQARDGADRDALLAVADCAMAAWEALVAARRQL